MTTEQRRSDMMRLWGALLIAIVASIVTLVIIALIFSMMAFPVREPPLNKTSGGVLTQVEFLPSH